MSDKAAGDSRPLVVGIGGTTTEASSTEQLMLQALRAIEDAGARTSHFGGSYLSALPHYSPRKLPLTSEQARLIDEVRKADAVIIATPCYHGGVSGLVKNALDMLDETRHDARPYFDGRAVGCIVTSYGAQAGGVVLTSLRSIVHALRGWPTPYGVAINVLESPVTDWGVDSTVDKGVMIMVQQIISFLRRPE